MTNVVVIVADDMRFDHLPYMSIVRSRLGAKATSFVHARCNVALCQPSRVGFFTGQLSRHHGELGVGLKGTTFKGFDQTVAAWLAEAGYRCGMFGKFINGVDDFSGIDAPTGWSTWREYTKERSEEDFDVRHESGWNIVAERGVYQTEYLATEASAFIKGMPEPWFCYVAPKQPHAPFAPDPQDLHAWARARCKIVDLPDTAHKPPWIRALPRLTANDRATIRRDFRGRLRELNAVDRMVGQILDAVESSPGARRTAVIFTSDNGVHQGEQRRIGTGTKAGPYEVGLRVPLLAAGPGFEAGRTVDVPVYSSQDITATLTDLAGAAPLVPNQAGISLRELADDPSAHRERALLHEVPPVYPSTGDGVTTGPGHALGHLKLFRYPSVRESGTAPRIFEMYDLARDPDELHNLADQAARRDERDALEGLLDDLLTP